MIGVSSSAARSSVREVRSSLDWVVPVSIFTVLLPFTFSKFCISYMRTRNKPRASNSDDENEVQIPSANAPKPGRPPVKKAGVKRGKAKKQVDSAGCLEKTEGGDQSLFGRNRRW